MNPPAIAFYFPSNWELKKINEWLATHSCVRHAAPSLVRGWKANQSWFSQYVELLF